MSAPNDALRRKVAALEGDGAPPSAVLPFHVAELDRRLPKGGLAIGCLHEVTGGGNGAVDGAAAACSAAGIAARLPGSVLWCVTQADLLAPGLEQAGLPPDRVIYVEAGDDTSVLACMEEGQLVAVRQHQGRLAFAAPPLLRSGEVDDANLRFIFVATGAKIAELEITV